MREAHIFAMPTKNDSHGRVFWEAMAAGCALLAPNTTPHQELFAAFGRTADATSPADVTRALGELAGSPQFCLERGLHARSEFLKKYHYSVAGAAYHEAFRRAAATLPTARAPG
ncbi:MAG: glycosyltransferase family 4 protein [Armatimonadetes bacterium]|nr:glycosyltransferase family 4 protein [Armatimonadota bacterium]